MKARKEVDFKLFECVKLKRAGRSDMRKPTPAIFARRAEAREKPSGGSFL